MLEGRRGRQTVSKLLCPWCKRVPHKVVLQLCTISVVGTVNLVRGVFSIDSTVLHVATRRTLTVIVGVIDAAMRSQASGARPHIFPLRARDLFVLVANPEIHYRGGGKQPVQAWLRGLGDGQVCVLASVILTAPTYLWKQLSSHVELVARGR